MELFPSHAYSGSLNVKYMLKTMTIVSKPNLHFWSFFRQSCTLNCMYLLHHEITVKSQFRFLVAQSICVLQSSNCNFTITIIFLCCYIICGASNIGFNDLLNYGGDSLARLTMKAIYLSATFW